jgi:hemerythrin-like domain-containing protein
MEMDEQFFNILHQEHEAVMITLNQMQQAATRNGGAAGELWEKFKQQITPHLIGEEKTFYATLKEIPKAKKYAVICHEQHQGLERAIFEMNSLPPQDTQNWMNEFTAFRNKLQQHIQFEEGILFGATEEVLDHSRIKDLMVKYKEAQNDARMVSIQGRYEGGFVV